MLARYRKAVAALTGAATPSAGLVAALEALGLAYPSWLPAAVAVVAGAVTTAVSRANEEPVSLVDQPPAQYVGKHREA